MGIEEKLRIALIKTMIVNKSPIDDIAKEAGLSKFNLNNLIENLGYISVRKAASDIGVATESLLTFISSRSSRNYRQMSILRKKYPGFPEYRDIRDVGYFEIKYFDPLKEAILSRGPFRRKRKKKNPLNSNFHVGGLLLAGVVGYFLCKRLPW